MTKTISVKELKELLAKYNDNDVIELNANGGNDGYYDFVEVEITVNDKVVFEYEN